MNNLIYILVFLSLFVISCSKVQESAGVTRKSIDEFKVIENPPLVIPPDFNLLPPEQLEEKNINQIESELAEEILYGLDEEQKNDNVSSFSTINKILIQTEANNIDPSIREEIDQEFVNEKNTNNIFILDWEDDVEILDAIKESERIRNQKFEGKDISEGDVPTSKTKINNKKKKKKKRFFFF